MHTAFGEIPDRFAADMTNQERHEYLRVQRSRLSRRRFLQAIGAGAGALAAGPVLLTRAAAAAVPVGAQHLQFGADPRTTMVVSWRTVGAVGGRPVVRVGTDASYGRVVDALSLDPAAEIPDGDATVMTAKTSSGSRVQHAVVDGLTPDTTYHYQVDNGDGSTGPDTTFTTAPATSRPFTFTAYGDSDPTQPDTATLIGLIGGAKSRFHLLAGDICYANNSGSGAESDVYNPTAWDTYLDQVGAVGGSIPWMVATGNHDMEPGYGGLGYDGVLQRFVPPTATTPGTQATSYYSFVYGNVGVVSLDANDVSNEIRDNLNYSQGAQTVWLAQTLAALRANPAVDFIVAYFHHCMYSTNAFHTSDGGPRQAWGGLFDTYTVDLVVNGHNHSYERSYPIKGGQTTGAVLGGPAMTGAQAPMIDAVRQGTTYITNGGGGRVAYPTFLTGASTVITAGGTRTPETAPWAGVENRYGTGGTVLVIDVVPAPAGMTSTMRLRALRAVDAGVQDEVVLTRTARASAVTPVLPEGNPLLLGLAGAGAVTAAAVVLSRRGAGNPPLAGSHTV